jgi:hypothetical protein
VALLKKSDKRNQASEMTEWEATRQRVQSFLDRAEHFEGFTNAQDPSLALPLAGDERALLVVHGAQLIAPRRLPGHWMGGTTGITFHVAKGMNARLGANRGHYVPGDEQPEVVDTGVATFTDHRVVFTGTRHSQEWEFDKVLGYHHEDGDSWTAIPVSNRQTVSGLRYNHDHAEEIRFALALGLARFHHSVDALVTDLRMQLSDVDRSRPGGPMLAAVPTATAVSGEVAVPAPVTPPVAPPGAYPDPAAPAASAAVTTGPAAGWAGPSAPVAPMGPVEPAGSAGPIPGTPAAADQTGAAEAEPAPATTAAATGVPTAPQEDLAVTASSARPEDAGTVAGPDGIGAPGATTELAPTTGSTDPAAVTTGPAATSSGPLAGGTPAGVAQAGPAPVATGPAPGWYPDPYGAARLRWWDGTTWTGYVSP